MSLTNVLMIVAILVAPLAALQVQKWLDTSRSITDQRKDIFHILMATRLARLSPDHVNALNRIDLNFRKVAAVESAWRDYRKHLNEVLPVEAEKEQHAAWNATSDQLFTNLLFEMSSSLKYGFERDYLWSTAYRPRAYQLDQHLQDTVRLGMFHLFSNNYALPIRLIPEPLPQSNESNRPEQERLRDEHERPQGRD